MDPRLFRAQLSSKQVRNEQDRRKCVRYSMEYREEQRAMSGLLPLGRGRRVRSRIGPPSICGIGWAFVSLIFKE
jgi:hypothetical protein